MYRLVQVKQAGKHSRSAFKEKDAIRVKGILHHPFLSRHYGPGCDVA